MSVLNFDIELCLVMQNSAALKIRFCHRICGMRHLHLSLHTETQYLFVLFRKPCRFGHDLMSPHNAQVLGASNLLLLDRAELCVLLMQNDTSFLPPVSALLCKQGLTPKHFFLFSHSPPTFFFRTGQTSHMKLTVQVQVMLLQTVHSNPKVDFVWSRPIALSFRKVGSRRKTAASGPGRKPSVVM